MAANNKKKKKVIITVLAVVAAFACVFLIFREGEGKPSYIRSLEEFYESSYLDYLTAFGFEGAMAQQKVVVNVCDFTTKDGMDAVINGDGVATSEWGSITWEFLVEEAGFYNLLVTYRPLSGTGSQISRVLYLDDEICYSGLGQVTFQRTFTDEDPEILVKGDNEVRPGAKELFRERSVYVEDAQRRGFEPFKLYLEKGRHTLTFESTKEPMEILGLVFESRERPGLYRDVVSGLKETYEVYSGDAVYCQAERVMDATTAITRSSSSITIRNNVSDPELMPYHPYHIVYNTIGGDNWKYSGDSVEWEIEVPKEGLYHLAFKGRQSINRGVTSYRRLCINGEVPFLEAEALPFTYSTKMKNYVIGEGTEDGPYLFYFKEGINTVSLEVVLGDFGETYTQISESVMVLNEMYRKIIQITGTVPDQYIDYEIVKKLPEFVEVAGREAARLRGVLEDVIAITGEKGENANLVEKMAIQLENLLADPEKVAVKGELSNFKSNITSLATWLIQIAEMPLELDAFALFGDTDTLKPGSANFAKGFGYDTIRFLATFFTDDTEVSTDEEISKQAIKVWLATGRDQAQVIRNLIDERFTPMNGIGVNLELVPLDVLVPATLAGTGPDVVLSVDQTKMMDFAMRNSLVDLSSLAGFDEVIKVFYPSALEGVTYQEQVFGLPETQSFSMLFYRKDIFEALGLTPPVTWDEYREIMPVLQMNNYDAHIPGAGGVQSILATMLVQKGGDLYLGEGKSYGVASGLSEKVAMETFKDLTDFFTAYKLPVSVDFANRFRTGEIPVGIADYTEYNRFELLAPEIKNLWSFAPMPGVLKEDGTVDNTVVCTTVQSIMLKTAEERGRLDEAWAFLKWWMDTETQLEYANSIEAILGSSARYATANKEVLARLPWAKKDLEKILEQFEHTKGIPPVPGHYMTSRMLEYTFDNVVTGGANPRETLYLKIKEINAELTKKRKEFRLQE